MPETFRKTRADGIAERIRTRIISGHYAPGSFLPPTRDLAREHSASCRTITDALERLSRDGLITRRKGQGTRVLSPARERSRAEVAVVQYTASPGTSTEGSLLLSGATTTLDRLGIRFTVIPTTLEWPPRFEMPSNARSVDALATLDREFSAVLFLEAYRVTKPILEIEGRRSPLVIANLEHDIPVTATKVDHETIGRIGAEFLMACGHRRIAFLGRDETLLPYYGHFRQGCETALLRAGIRLDPDLVHRCASTGPLEGYQAAQALLSLPNPPTAIFGSRDAIAEGVCHAVEERGLVVGRDVSVIGYDNISWAGDTHGLTTFQEPCKEMGALAAEMLIERMVRGWRPPEQRILPTPLIVRRSVGPCPGAPPQPAFQAEWFVQPVRVNHRDAPAPASLAAR